MPPSLPLHYEAVYISGVFEIVGALGILLPRFRQMAGNGLILLTLAVSPANIYMWMTPEAFPELPTSALTIRLFIQVLLLICIWKSTRAEKETPAAELGLS